MNLEESDAYKEELERTSRRKKSIMISIVICIIITLFLIALIIYILYKDSVTLKYFIDNKQVTKVPSDFSYVKNDKRYVSIEDLAKLLGYTYTKGIYGQANENEDSGYFDTGFETVAVTAGKKEFKKYITFGGTDEVTKGVKATAKSNQGYLETFSIKDPIVFNESNKKLYITEEYISKMFNINSNWKEFRVKFETLGYIVNSVQKDISQLGYPEVSGYYENFRAMVDGYVIIGNGSQLYGVYDLKNKKEIISIKYKDIKYIQNTKEFYITADDGTVGLMNNEGKFIIDAGEYHDITLLDEENKLYIVEKNNEYGVLNRNGDIVVYVENDGIGYDVSDFSLEEEGLDNDKLWFGKCIPVKKDDKYGLYSKSGENELLLPLEPPLNYEGFGYKSTSKSKTSGNEQSVLLIPGRVGIQGIVIKYNDLYGIYDVNEEKIVLTCVFSKIYSITKNGETNYYIKHGEKDEPQLLEDYLKKNNLNNIDSKGNYINSPDYEEDLNDDSNNTIEDESIESQERNSNTLNMSNTTNVINTSIDNNTSNITNTSRERVFDEVDE